MCNLSQGIWNQGIQEGRREGILELLKNLFANNVPFDTIKKSAPDFSEAELIAIQKEVEAEHTA